MTDLDRAIERADEKVHHPVRFWLRESAWQGAVVPTAGAIWRLIVAAVPLWTAVTAVATAVMAYKTLRP